jgi:hypothetical protein
MAQRHRELTGLGAALVAHALVLAWIATRHLPPPPRFEPATSSPDAALDLVEEGPAEPPLLPALAVPAAAGSPGEPAAHGARGRLAMNAAGAGSMVPARSPSTVEAQSRGEETPPAPPAETGPALSGLSADALGIGTHNPFIGALPAAPSASPEEAPPPADNVAPGAQQALRDGIHEHDHDLGLDVGGPLVAVAEELTRPSATPVNSQAHFEVIADATGHVTSVRLLDASEGYDAWNELASSFEGALRDRALRVPSGTRGMAVTIEVTSRVQLPSGFDPGVDVSILNIPLKKAPADQKRPRRVEIFTIKPKIEEVPKDPSLSSPFKLPQYRIELVKIFGLAFDPVDIGVPAGRVVHARVVKERSL